MRAYAKYLRWLPRAFGRAVKRTNRQGLVDPLCIVESPDTFIVADKPFRVRGWVLSHIAIQQIDVIVCSTQFYPATYGITRPDVAIAHPEYISGEKCGFETLTIAFPNNAGDNFKITIVITTEDNKRFYRNQDIWVISSANEIIDLLSNEKIFPRHLAAAVDNFLEADAIEYANALASTAYQINPTDLSCALAYGRVATRQADLGLCSWSEALDCWQAIRRNFADIPENSRTEQAYALTAGYALIEKGRALVALKQFEEAEELTCGALERFSDHADLHAFFAEIATTRAGTLADHLQTDEYRIAQQRWASVRTRFPDNQGGYISGAEVCLATEDFDLAEELARIAITKFPSLAAAWACYANVATRKSSWSDARQRWDEAILRFPNDETIKIGQGRFHYLFSITSFDAEFEEKIKRTNDFLGPTAFTHYNSLSDRELMMAFENIGNNCEFGIVQRYFGAEPISLLRFAGGEFDHLLAALKAKFDGVGLAQNTRFELITNPRPEYWMSDTRFGLFMHTNIFHAYQHFS